MWEKFRAIFTIPELRQKIFFTLLLLAVFRVGYQIPLPIVDETALEESIKSGSSSDLFKFMQQVSVFSAAIMAGAEHVQAAKQLIAALSSPQADAAVRNSGMERPTRP